MSTRTLGDNVQVSYVILSSGVWDHAKIEQSFLPFEAERILEILQWQDLKKTWLCGIFQGLRFFCKEWIFTWHLGEGSCSSSSGVPLKCFWNKLWKLQVLCRIAIFLWHACLNAILVRTCLASRGVQLDPYSPDAWSSRLNQFLVLYGAARWFKRYRISVWPQFSNLGFLDAAIMFSKVRGGSLFKLFPVLCWLVWNNRNKFVFENKTMPLLWFALKRWPFWMSWLPPAPPPSSDENLLRR